MFFLMKICVCLSELCIKFRMLCTYFLRLDEGCSSCLTSAKIRHLVLLADEDAQEVATGEEIEVEAEAVRADVLIWNWLHYSHGVAGVELEM